MKWSWKLGEYAGIGVYVHATFFLLIAWVGFAHWFEGHNLAATLHGVIFILALFACVVLHEFGHALTAKKYGIATRDITLLPIGGVARLEKMPDDPRQEFWVALAGPAVNVVIALLLYVWLSLTGEWVPLEQLDMVTGPFLERLLAVNILLVLFNMLPAFPMDGGRVLRAVLAMRMDYVRATQIAATLGQSMAFLFGLVGLIANPFLLFIALFVWMGAEQEASLVTIRSALGGIPVSESMVTEFHTLSAGDNLDSAVKEILAGSQQDFPVLDGGEVVGILTRNDLLIALAKQGLEAPVSSVMKRDFKVVEAGDMLELAFRKLQDCDCRTMPVLRNGRLVGLYTMDNMGEFLAIQSALSQAKRSLKRSALGA